jgi:hypothetical protein
MSRNVVFLEDTFGPGWENELSDEARIETREETVRGLTAERYKQLWSLFQGAPGADVLSALANGMSVADAASAIGVSQRQVKNTVAQILARAAGAVAQKSFLPRPIATNAHIERRPRSRRGRPPKALPMAPGVRGQEQVALPF